MSVGSVRSANPRRRPSFRLAMWEARGQIKARQSQKAKSAQDQERIPIDRDALFSKSAVSMRGLQAAV
jgi:hypothetical protein